MDPVNDAVHGIIDAYVFSSYNKHIAIDHFDFLPDGRQNLNAAGTAKEAGLQHVVATVEFHTAHTHPPAIAVSIGSSPLLKPEKGAVKWIQSKWMIVPINPEMN